MPKAKKSKKLNFHKITQLSLGQKAADKMTQWVGSWTFIFALFVILAVWVSINLVAWAYQFDPYPFILMNLFLSCLAAVQAPIILMSQNRTTQRDRAKAERDYAVNRKAEREVADMQEDLEVIKKLIKKHKK